MPLQAPKRTPEGFLLSLQPPISSPPVTLTKGSWTLESNDAWCAWADDQRKSLLAELLSHGNWFSKPPRRDVLEPLFSLWYGSTLQGVRQLFTEGPKNETEGSGTWILEGLLMTASAITPVWTLGTDFQKVEQEAIPFFDEDREINLEEIESAGTAPTPIRNREWETRKFLAKERVREARLKAQIAQKMAEAEEARYYRHFGDLDDGESHFSDYDLSEDEDTETELS